MCLCFVVGLDFDLLFVKGFFNNCWFKLCLIECNWIVDCVCCFLIFYVLVVGYFYNCSGNFFDW